MPLFIIFNFWMQTFSLHSGKCSYCSNSKWWPTWLHQQLSVYIQNTCFCKYIWKNSHRFLWFFSHLTITGRKKKVYTNLLILTTAVFTNFKKALDKSSHNIQVARPRIHSSLFQWIRSFICKRLQAMVLNGVISFFSMLH